MDMQEIVKQVLAEDRNKIYIIQPDTIKLTSGGESVDFATISEGCMYSLKAKGIDYATLGGLNYIRESEEIAAMFAPSAILSDSKGICVIAGKNVFSTIDFSKELQKAQLTLENQARAERFCKAIDMANNSNNYALFAQVCREYNMYFDVSKPTQPDFLLSHIVNNVSNYLKDHNIEPEYISSLSHDELGYILADSKATYEREIKGTARTILDELHKTQKPIIMIGSISESNLQILKDLSGSVGVGHGALELEKGMILSVTPLAGPTTSCEQLNLSHRQVNNIIHLGSHGIIFSTEDGVFVHCSNKRVAQELRDMEIAFAKAHNDPLPQIGGVAGVRQLFAEHRNIQYPEALQEFVGTGGSYRDDALAVVQNICDDYNKQGVPIYATSKMTCFITPDRQHDSPDMLLPGDKFTISYDETKEDIRSIGDNRADVPLEATLIGIHTNKHGSIAITDAGVFVLGGIGDNIIQEICRLEQNQDLSFSSRQGPHIEDIGQTDPQIIDR